MLMIQAFVSLVQDILNYQGRRIDFILNYTAIVVTLTPIFLMQYQLPVSSRLRRFVWIPLLIFLFVFQISLCVAVGCIGVSIVWSALCGYSVFIYNTSFNPADDINGNTWLLLVRLCLSGAVVFSSALWIYYMVTNDTITSVAHFSAVLLGVACAFFLDLFDPSSGYTSLQTI